MKQCTQLKAVKDFTFKPSKKGARKITVRTGATFWVASSETMQRETGIVHLARVTQPIHYDYGFDAGQIAELFETVA